MTEIALFRNVLEQLKGQRKQLTIDLVSTQIEIKENKRSLRQHEQAREVIREVGLKTQQKLQYHISDITSLALEAVFDDPYELKVEFVQRRNQTECDLRFERGKLNVDPMEASGVGAIDVAAFALRVACWSMEKRKTRPIIIMDEPMRYLSVEYQERASAMIKEVSEKLGIQFLIVTHEEVLASYADKTFRTIKKKKITKVISK